MVVASAAPARNERIRPRAIPVIDLAWRRDRVLQLMVKACEEFGFFKVINHGVPESVVARMEEEGSLFFSLPAQEKQRAGPPNPLGYGSRNIGFNGDMGEVEYLLLHTNPAFLSQRARAISGKDPTKFSCVVNEYVEQVRQLACDILEMLGEGLGLRDIETFSSLIKDSESDSLLRLNLYPPNHNASINDDHEGLNPRHINKNKDGHKTIGRVGFGEHSDPQIISILRSNDVEGLQILHSEKDDGGGGVWVSVPADPTAFFVNVGDALQALTNGRLISVRHRAMANSGNPRLSIIFFGAPPPHALIAPAPETVTPRHPRRYKPFTWAEYKKATYALRLGHNRLNLFLEDGEEGGVGSLK